MTSTEAVEHVTPAHDRRGGSPTISGNAELHAEGKCRLRQRRGHKDIHGTLPQPAGHNGRCAGGRSSAGYRPRPTAAELNGGARNPADLAVALRSRRSAVSNSDASTSFAGRMRPACRFRQPRRPRLETLGPAWGGEVCCREFTKCRHQKAAVPGAAGHNDLTGFDALQGDGGDVGA